MSKKRIGKRDWQKGLGAKIYQNMSKKHLIKTNGIRLGTYSKSGFGIYQQEEYFDDQNSVENH